MFCSGKVGPRSWFHSVRGMPLRLEGSKAGAARAVGNQPTLWRHQRHSSTRRAAGQAAWARRAVTRQASASLEVQGGGGALASPKQADVGVDPGGELEVLVLWERGQQSEQEARPVTTVSSLQQTHNCDAVEPLWLGRDGQPEAVLPAAALPCTRGGCRWC